MRTAGLDGVHSQSSRQPVCILILTTPTYERIPTLFSRQLVHMLGDAHMALGLTTFSRGKLNTPLK